MEAVELGLLMMCICLAGALVYSKGRLCGISRFHSPRNRF